MLSGFASTPTVGTNRKHLYFCRCFSVAPSRFALYRAVADRARFRNLAPAQTDSAALAQIYGDVARILQIFVLTVQEFTFERAVFVKVAKNFFERGKFFVTVKIEQVGRMSVITAARVDARARCKYRRDNSLGRARVSDRRVCR